MSVLIVDDDDDIRETLKELCEDEGYDVATAANGLQAMEALGGAILPCVVILDLIMPFMTGNEVFAQMQQDQRLAKVPVIVSTSDPSRAPSGVLIMKKPIDLDRLLGAIRRYCGPP
ncbi:MAG TPA: response regulator [Polyangiaceae bacterium]|jgi:CheY-like chemotaxis protein|nr:response regulator [Polyangiaceae bacterium]